MFWLKLYVVFFLVYYKFMYTYNVIRIKHSRPEPKHFLMMPELIYYAFTSAQNRNRLRIRIIYRRNLPASKSANKYVIINFFTLRGFIDFFLIYCNVSHCCCTKDLLTIRYVLAAGRGLKVSSLFRENSQYGFLYWIVLRCINFRYFIIEKWYRTNCGGTRDFSTNFEFDPL